MPGGIGDCAAMPRPLAKMEMNSSKSTAMAMAWRRLRALSELQCESLRLSPLMELLAIRLGWDTTPAKSLVIPSGEGWGGGASTGLAHTSPTTGSSQLKPVYMVEVDTAVDRLMPCAFISLVTAASPPTATCTAWSKLSELMPEAS